MSWNCYPSFTRNSIIKRLKTSPKKVEKEKEDRKIIWIRLPYLGNISDNMKKNCFKKVQKCLRIFFALWCIGMLSLAKQNIAGFLCFITSYETNIFF